MRREQDEAKSQSQSLAERMSIARATLTALAKTGYKTAVARQIRGTLLKLPQIAEQVSTEAINDRYYPVARTQDPLLAKKIFLGFKDDENPSEPFEIDRQDITYMVNPRTTDVLLAQAMHDTRIFGLTAVQSTEQHIGKDGTIIYYLAIRLTPRKFQPRNLQPPVNTSG